MHLLSLGKRISKILQGSSSRGLITLLTLMIIRAVMDTIGVASVLPFIAVVTDPTQVFENSYLTWTFETLRFQNTHGFLVFLGVFSLVMLFISN